MPVPSDAKHLWILIPIWMADVYGNDKSGLHSASLKFLFDERIAKLKDRRNLFEALEICAH